MDGSHNMDSLLILCEEQRVKLILEKKRKKECFPRLIILLICRKREESVDFRDSLIYQCCFSAHDFTASGTGIL